MSARQAFDRAREPVEDPVESALGAVRRYRGRLAPTAFSPSILSTLLLVAVAVAGMAVAATPSAARAQRSSLEAADAPHARAPWTVALGVEGAFADFAGAGLGFEKPWAAGAVLGVTRAVGRAADVGVELLGRFNGFTEQMTLDDLPGYQLIPYDAAVYSFAPSAQLSRTFSFEEAPVGLALTARVGAMTERSLEPRLRGRDPNGLSSDIEVPFGPRSRTGLLVALAAGIDFEVGTRGLARLEAGYSLMRFARDTGPESFQGLLLPQASGGLRHEATLRLSVRYRVQRAE